MNTNGAKKPDDRRGRSGRESSANSGRCVRDAADVALQRHLHFGWGRHLPMIFQTEAAECGPACLAMIACYYGHHTDLRMLRERFPMSLKGLKLGLLMTMAQSLSLVCRPLRLDLNELSHLGIPCILHWNMDHFVVLRSVHKRSATIHDPAVGIRRVRNDELSAHWTGVAIELSCGPAFKRAAPPPPISLRKLAGSVHGLTQSLAIILSLAMLLELITLAWPQFLQITIDQVLADHDYSLLTLLGVSFLVLLAMQTLVSALRTWTVIWLGTHFKLSWIGNVFQHLLRLPQPYFMKRHLGDIVSRFSAVDVIQQTLTTQFVGVLLDGLMGSFTLVVMLIYSAELTAVVVLSIGVYAVVRLCYYRVYFDANLSQITVRAKQQSVLLEAIRGVQTLRLHNRGPAHTGRFLNAATDTLNTSIAVQKLKLVFSSINGLTRGLERIGVLWLAADLALSGKFSAGMLMAYVAYANQFTNRASALVNYVVQLKLMRMQGDRLADIMLTDPEPDLDARWVGPRPQPTVRFEHVSFCYGSGEPMVLKDCSFEVKAGESVAITGPSGGGKSTVVRLLMGLVDPQAGHITIGGVDLKRLGKWTWRGMAGCVMQNDTLFAGTIADNISFHDDASSPGKVEAAAKLAQIHDDIIAMPMGYHTRVGDMGSTLSGGQLQRIFLARALYKQPVALILDEATSHIDVPCERKIVAMLNTLDRTRIVIAHRPETLRMADRVLVCLGGTVREVQLSINDADEADSRRDRRVSPSADDTCVQPDKIASS